MTLRLTRDDVRGLIKAGRLAPHVFSAMTWRVFVPGPLYNPLNGPHEHWSKRARWARQWRERTALCLFHAWPATEKGKYVVFTDTTPKRVAFLAHTGATWDDDNLRAGLKPIRDALTTAGIISGDAPRDGHTFTYDQRIDRKNRGVWITIEDETRP